MGTMHKPANSGPGEHGHVAYFLVAVTVEILFATCTHWLALLISAPTVTFVAMIFHVVPRMRLAQIAGLVLTIWATLTVLLATVVMMYFDHVL